MAKSKWFLLFIISFLSGIIAGDFYVGEDFLKLGVLFFVWVIVIFYYFDSLCEYREWKFRFAAFLLFSFFGILLGGLRFFVSFEYGDQHIRNFEGYFEVEGCVCDEVDVRNDKVKYTLETERILVDGKWEDVWGRVLVNGDRYPIYEYGDCLGVSGKIEIPEAIEDFAYDKYLSRYSIYAVIYRADVEKVPGGGGNIFYEWIYDFKGVFEGRLSKIFAEPHNSFMAGLILGSRRGIPDHLMQDFNVTGLTHIIAISGYNITLVIVVVSGIFGFLSRRMKVLAASVFIIVFTILVGASAAVTRAAIMGVISLIALWYGRPYLVMIGLFSAAFLMNLWNPKILVYDVGFQLSFLATFGIVIVSPLMEKYFKWVPGVFGVREAVQMTLSAQVFALPVILLNFGRLSVVSPIANVFVLPFIPLSMVFGFFSVLFSFLSGWLGDFVGFFGYLFLELIIFFVKIFASFGFASMEVEWFSWWIFILYYWLLFKKILLPMLSRK